MTQKQQLQTAEEARSFAGEGFRRTKNMRWRLRSRRLSRLRKKPSLQLRLLADRNKLHTIKKAGQRAAGVVREGYVAKSGS